MNSSKNAPRVVIDARMVSEIPHGISKYVSYLAKSLASDPVKKRGLSYEPVFLVNSSSPSLSGFQTVPLSSPFLHPKELIEIPRVLRHLNASLYHSPSFASLWTCPCPWIVTVHDLNHLTYGSLSKKIYYRFLLRRFAKKSKALVTVSKFSQRELSEWLGVPGENIRIVYNVIEAEAASDAAVLEKYGLKSGQYFFCLSNPKPHKNLPLLVEAYQRFSQQQKGAWPFVTNVLTFSNLPGVQALGGLPENEARALSANAGGVLFPSLYEGFGLPPVEAAVLGTPIAVSRIPPHEEGLTDLTQSEVHWVGPQDLHGWVNAFHKLTRGDIRPPSPQSRLKILDRFSLERMGQSMDQIYRNMLGLNP